MTHPQHPSPEYVLGHSDAETRRLIIQNQLYGPTTRRLFTAAGIGAGMRVLDIGCGAGDVSLLLADLVGPRGQVVGVDMNPAILETARQRTAAAGWRNVSFEAGDARGRGYEGTFDAVVGRWVLMYIPEPVAMVRELAALLRPGGVIAFQELDFTNPPGVIPPSELSTKLSNWIVPPPGAPGPDMRIGSKLLKVYVEAGLPRPDLTVETVAGGGVDWPGYAYLTETVRGLLPVLQRVFGVDAAALDVDTLEARLREDITSRNAIQTLPTMFGAWARRS
jgi:ubiquinone/menaquinone biosynthesis C-methylase UbiE